MDLLQAQTQFQALLHSVDPHILPSFLEWMKHYTEEKKKALDESNEDILLEQIRQDIRKELPKNAMLPSENIVFPTFGCNADCNPETTVHVDAFLYPEDVVDDLCDRSEMSRNYCMKCGSHQTSPLTFISHSISGTQLKYIFQYLLPDLRARTILDVGSRIGAVLYGAYYYSGASRVIGVEMNADLCRLQQCIINKYHLEDRTMVICSDICDQLELLKSADVVVLHNVFEFFVPMETQKQIWTCLRQCIQRSGVLLVLSPDLQQSTAHLQLSLEDWVEEVSMDQYLAEANLAFFGAVDSEESDLDNIFLYKVK